MVERVFAAHRVGGAGAAQGERSQCIKGPLEYAQLLLAAFAVTVDESIKLLSCF